MSMDSYHIFEVIEYKDVYRPEYVLDYSATNPSFWLAPEGVVNVGFTIDRGCSLLFDRIVIINTFNETGFLR